MPAATEAFTSAGTTVGISLNTVPSTKDNNATTGYPSLTFTAIAEITEAGEFGRQYNLVTHMRLDERRTVKRKGSFNDGQMTLQLARVTSDAGQTALVSALDSDADSAFEVTLQDGTKLWFDAQVLSYTTNVGNVDQITGSTVVVEITSDIIEETPA
jgi:hypothetical protein